MKEVEIGAGISTEELVEGCVKVAYEIFKRYEKNPFTLLAIGEGGVRFAHEVELALKHMGARPMFTVIGARSYQGTEKKGLEIYDLPSFHLLDKCHVVVLDDIVDTGTTLNTVASFIKKRYRVKGMEVGAMVVKKLFPWMQPDYCMFKIAEDSGFVVGFGLDHDGKYRDENVIRLLVPCTPAEAPAILPEQVAVGG